MALGVGGGAEVPLATIAGTEEGHECRIPMPDRSPVSLKLFWKSKKYMWITKIRNSVLGTNEYAYYTIRLSLRLSLQKLKGETGSFSPHLEKQNSYND